MKLIPIKLPPGMFKNGTPYAAKNRWADGNLIRWHDGSLRPVGGWEILPNSSPIVMKLAGRTYRDGFVWTDNNDNLAWAFGSNDNLVILDADYVATDVTPVGFVGTPNVPTANRGYGKGPYGTYTYGTPRIPSQNDATQVWRWQFDAWGEDLIAAANSTEFRGGIYSCPPDGGTLATLIPNAPTDVNGAVVTDQRMIMSIGSNVNPRLVQWSDREDREDWTPTEQNLAGSQFLDGNGALVYIGNVLNQQLILSETDAHVARYIGAPFAYGFDKVGTDCGPLGPGTVHITDRFAMWMGRRKFWIYDGTVREVPCDVMDFIAEDVNNNGIGLMHTVGISQYSEIWWFYQSNGASDIDSYVSFDYQEGHWQVGKLDRTVGVDGFGIVPPVMVDFGSAVYRHEQRGILPNNTYAETGPLELGEGDVNMAVRYLFPDAQTTDSVSYTLLGRDMPTSPEFSYGPYAYNNPVDTRAMGREIRMRVDGLEARWEVGPATRFDVAVMGVGAR